MLTATEYHMREPLPLATIHESILDFCRGRTDVVVFVSDEETDEDY
jgi:hypothetical protein